MKIINNPQKMNTYIEKYNLNQLFSQDMSSYMKLYFFKSREFIYREEDAFTHVYFFVDGKAKVFNETANGRSLLLCFYKPLQVLGDVELMEDKMITSNVEVIDDAYCIGMPVDKVRSLLINDLVFLKYLCRNLGTKLVRSSRYSSVNMLYPLENRLASYILGVGISHEKGKDLFTFFDTLTVISELLGASYRHLLRTLNNLMEKGIISRHGDVYEVLDMDTLEELGMDMYQDV